MITAADLMKPTTMTCAQCGSPSVHIPMKTPKKLRGYDNWFAWAVENAKATCPHCTPLAKSKWPEWLGGKVVKPCACGSATCPVPAWAERLDSTPEGT